MNALSLNTLTMTSREIADLTGKNHGHVMRDIRALQAQLGSNFGGSIQIWIHPQNGQNYEEFALDKDTCLTLLLGYDPAARMKVVKRWQELENALSSEVRAGAANFPIPQTLSEALRLAADLADEKEQALQALAAKAAEAEQASREASQALQEKALLEANVQEKEAKIAEDAPKVAFSERHAKAEGWYCLRDAAKVIGIKESDFIVALLRDGFVYRDKNKRIQAYSSSIQRGLLDVRSHLYTSSNGSEKVNAQVMVLPKGIEYFQFRFQMLASASSNAA